MLTRVESDIVRQCVTAVLKGPFIEDFEFHTRLGVNRTKLKDMLNAWPDLNKHCDETHQLIVNNCMNEVCHGFTIPSDEWNKWFSVPKELVKSTYSKWRESQEFNGGIK